MAHYTIGEYQPPVFSRHGPTCSHQLFMAHAWIAGTPPERLERYVDVPWTPLGDLYYMHKLAETIKAYRGVRWE